MSYPKYKTGRRPHLTMPASKKDLCAVLNEPHAGDRLIYAAAKLQVSKVTICAWMKHFGVRRVSMSYYE